MGVRSWKEVLSFDRYAAVHGDRNILLASPWADEQVDQSIGTP